MKTATYRVVMKSGRRFLVEEIRNGQMQWKGTHTGSPNQKIALVKEMVTSYKDGATTTSENKFKNSCIVSAADSAIEYINTLDALGLERINSEAVQYIDL